MTATDSDGRAPACERVRSLPASCSTCWPVPSQNRGPQSGPYGTATVQVAVDRRSVQRRRKERNRPQPVRSGASGPASLRAFSPPVPSAPADVRQPVQGGERSANLKRLRQRAKPVVNVGGKPNVFREAETPRRGWVSCRDVPGANAPGNPVANCDTDPDLPRRGKPTGVTRCAGRPLGESISGRKDSWVPGEIAGIESARSYVRRGAR